MPINANIKKTIPEVEAKAIDETKVETETETETETEKVEIEKAATVEKVETVKPDDDCSVASLRLDQSFLETTVEKVIITVPVRRPNNQDFIRVNPDPAYRTSVAMIELRDERQTFVLRPHIAAALPGQFSPVMLFTAINRQGVVSLWPVKLPMPDGRMIEWHRSAMEAAEMAMTRWLRVVPNMSMGGYDIIAARGAIPDPVWPTLSFDELLKIAFRGNVVSSFDHPLIKRLHGIV